MAKKKRDEREREKMVNNEGKTFKKAEKTQVWKLEKSIPKRNPRKTIKLSQEKTLKENLMKPAFVLNNQDLRTFHKDKHTLASCYAN